MMMSENETITPDGAGESGRKTVDFEKINDTLRARLKKVAAIAETALLAETVLANRLHKHDQCWEHLMGALGRIETEMLIHARVEKPLDPNAPEMVRGEKPWKPLEITECGIDFRRYHSKSCEVFVCAWKDGHGNNSHVYEVRVRKVEEEKWVATLSNDGRKLCTLSAPSRQLAYRCALGAMRDYLRRGHRRTLRRFAEKAAKGGRAEAKPSHD